MVIFGKLDPCRIQFVMAVLTTSSGNPVDDNQNSMTAGPHGPM